MRIAVATSDRQKVQYPDIDLLITALAQEGAVGEEVIWDNLKVDWASYDVVLIDSTWNYSEKLETFLDWCETVSSVSRLVNSHEIIKLSSNKRYLLKLEAAGLSIPFTHITEALTSVGNESLRAHQGRVVIKPLVGAEAVDTFLFENLEVALKSPTFTRINSKGAVLVQSYMSEIKTLGEVSAVFIAGRLSHCFLKMPGSKDFRVQPRFGGTVALIEAPEYTEGLYQRVITALGVKPLYARLDFIPTDAPTIMEVEMVEPDKFFFLYPEGARTLATALTS